MVTVLVNGITLAHEPRLESFICAVLCQRYEDICFHNTYLAHDKNDQTMLPMASTPILSD